MYGLKFCGEPASMRGLADYQPPKQDVIPRTQGRLRFNERVFFALVEARERIEAWRHDYNHLRPDRTAISAH